MNKIFAFIFVFINLSGFSQNQDYSWKLIRDHVTPLDRIFNPGDIPAGAEYLAPSTGKMPEHYNSDIKRELDRERAIRMDRGYRSNYVNPAQPSELLPEINRGFEGAQYGGAPNDNHMAVSKNGWVISVLNTFIRVYDDTGKFIKTWSLTQFPRTPNTWPDQNQSNLTWAYDPKVMYDQEADRFIIVYLHQYVSSTNYIVAAFSSTNNPLDPWYIYKIPGNPLNNSTWSDYPITSLSKDELFITVNLLKDGQTDWRKAFTQSVIWQISKWDGFAGRSLNKYYWYDLKYQNKPIWSICPVLAADEYADGSMYFMSVRPSDRSNDSLFLHHISGTQTSGKTEYSLRLFKSDNKYGLPPTAYQPSSKYRLQTNDARVLTAFSHGDMIQWAQTSIEPASMNSCIFHGVIRDLNGSASVKTHFIVVDSLDFAYPSMAWAGNGRHDQSSILTFSHCGTRTFPGTSAVYFDRYGAYSPVQIIKQGNGNIVISGNADTNQRWGDYTNIQRVPGSDSMFYLVGSFGKTITGGNDMGTWISRVKVNTGTRNISPDLEFNLFPNPARDKFYMEFEAETAGEYTLTITDMLGRDVGPAMKKYFTQGFHYYAHSGSWLRPGIYKATVSGPMNRKILSRTLMIE